VLSYRSLCDELITRTEESYRLCCVVLCDLETSKIDAPYIYIYIYIYMYIYIYDISSLRVNLYITNMYKIEITKYLKLKRNLNYVFSNDSRYTD
jgi:hypothetical protein